MTSSSKSAWKQIESWLSLLFKTTMCCVWLFKRYADYFCAWHYAAMFFINIFKHFLPSLSWWMMNNTSVTKLSLMKCVFLHLFTVFLMSAWVRGCTITVHCTTVSQTVFILYSFCIRKSITAQGLKTEVLIFTLITSQTFSFYLWKFSYCSGEV